MNETLSPVTGRVGRGAVRPPGDKEAAMKCHRCGGAMIYEKFYGGGEQFYGWRCIFCGEIVDQIIFENRKQNK
jgi:hypothetical protein